MKILAHDHQGKSHALLDAIIELGHELVFANPEVLLIDHDGPDYYRRIIENANADRVILYPHGAGVFPAWDGVFEPHPETSVMMTWGSGQKEVLEQYGYPNPVVEIGWFLCERKPFRPFQGERPSVLYGPVHPLSNGEIRREYFQRNKQVYSQLLAHYNDGAIGGLTVRPVGNLGQSGLFPAHGVKYERGDLLEQIERADLVVANGTMAYLAIARGCPTVMFDKGVPYMDDGRLAEHWKDYADQVCYPYQFFDNDWQDVFVEEPDEWSERFLGKEFDRQRFDDLIRGRL